MAYIFEDTDGNYQTYESAVSVKEEDGKYVVYAPFDKILAVIPKTDVKRISSNED